MRRVGHQAGLVVSRGPFARTRSLPSHWLEKAGVATMAEVIIDRHRARPLAEPGVDGVWSWAPMEINGIAHIQLTVSSFEACARFYKPLMELFEMSLVFDDDDVKYWVGGRTAVAITRCA